MSKISACLILCDDGKHIEKCLKSILYLDEIIIVIDKKSKDKTEKIVREYAKENKHIRIFKRTWGGFSNQRNFSMSKATGDHILIIDGDEVLQTKYPLHEYIKKYKGDIYRVVVENKKKKIIQYCYNLRMWKNGIGIKYKETMHENINDSMQELAKKRNVRMINLKSMSLIHYGYELTDKQWKAKVNRNLKNHLIQLKKSPNNPTVHYHLALIYHSKKDYNKALYYIHLALHTDRLTPDYKVFMYNRLALIHYEMDDVTAALRYLDKAFEVIPNQLMGRYLLHEILVRNGIKGAKRIEAEIKDITINKKSELQNDPILPLEEINPMLRINKKERAYNC